MNEKYQALLDAIRPLGSAVVAFSGGVDSTRFYSGPRTGPSAIGASRSPPSPRLYTGEAGEAAAIAAGSAPAAVRRHRVRGPGFVKTSTAASYCKRELFVMLRRIADLRRLTHLMEGTNLSDLSDLGPACAPRRDVDRQPLWEAGLTKDDVRSLSRGSASPRGTARQRLPRLARPVRDAGHPRFSEIARAEGSSRGSASRVGPCRAAHRDRRQGLRRSHTGGDPALRESGFVHVSIDLASYRTAPSTKPPSPTTRGHTRKRAALAGTAPFRSGSGASYGPLT